MAYDYLAAVAEIRRRYPPARIAASQARLLDVWNGDGPEPSGPRGDGIPFVFTGVPNTTDANGGMLYEARYPARSCWPTTSRPSWPAPEWRTTTSPRYSPAAARV